MEQRPVGGKAAAILGNDRQAAVQRLGSEPGEMRRHDDIRQIEERIMRAGRLVGKYLEPGAAQTPTLQRRDERRLVWPNSIV